MFIEERKNRADHLAALLDARFPPSSRPAQLQVAVLNGTCHELFESALASQGGWDGPVFANLDGWGVDTHFDVIKRIATQQSSEVLVTFQDQFFKRFAAVDGQEAGDRVFGNRTWREVANEPTNEKTAFLLRLYRHRLHDAGFPYILTFEMTDEGGHVLYLFFGTTSKAGVVKFKDGLWVVDGVEGQRFKDPRNADQLAFEMNDPNFRPLEDEFLRLLSDGPRDLVTLQRHTLLETIYKPTHARHAIERLVQAGEVQQTANGRSDRERTYALADPSLFTL